MESSQQELTALESTFFYLSKVLIYKTLSSPFRVTHLLLQSKNLIIEQHEINQYKSRSYTQLTLNALKSIIFGTSANDPNTDNTASPMIKYLQLKTNGNTLNFIINIINNPQYGASYLFVGGLYNILRGLILQKSCSKAYNLQKLRQHKNKHIGRRYLKGFISWTATTSCLWSSSLFALYPLHCAYINYLFDFDGIYKLPPFTLSGIKQLFAGYPIAMMQSLLHSVLHYKFTDILIAENRENQKLEQMMIKYICMCGVNVLCYPLDTIKKRQMITDESIGIAFDRIVCLKNGGFWSLFDGVQMYLLKCLISQVCIDAFDAFIEWYKRQKVGGHEHMRSVSQGIVCDICMDAPKEFAFNCGHCVCGNCKEVLIQRSDRCHICRKEIESVQQVFI